MPTPAALKVDAAAARAWLFDAALPIWWTHGFDREAACFHERLALDAKPVRSPRRVRAQARQTYVYACAGALGWPGPWRAAVEAGAEVLTGRALHADGGVIHTLDADGRPGDLRRDLYDTAFVIFALAHAGRALGDRPDLIAHAARLADWVEETWRDPAGGYHEGEVAAVPPRRQNPHMHLLEALLALHEATGAPRFLARADAIAALFTTRLLDRENGAVLEYFTPDWAPAPGEDGRIAEPGHQFEWAWLLDRRRRLGGAGAPSEAEALLAHGERFGVDRSGTAIDEVWAEGGVRTPTARLWPQTERIKANIVAYERTGDGAAAGAAHQAFEALMRYCAVPIPGLWRDRKQPDGGFVEEAAPASSFYHIILALQELIRVAEAL